MPDEIGNGTAPAPPIPGAPARPTDSGIGAHPAPNLLTRPLTPRPRQDEIWVEFSLRELEEEIHRVRCGKKVERPRDSEGWGLIGLAGGAGIALATGWEVLLWFTLFLLGVLTATGVICGTFILVTAKRSRDDSAKWADIVERDLMLIRGRTEPSFVTGMQQLKLGTTEVHTAATTPETR